MIREPLPKKLEVLPLNSDQQDGKRSLNKEYRKRELLKITLENYELLKRLN